MLNASESIKQVISKRLTYHTGMGCNCYDICPLFLQDAIQLSSMKDVAQLRLSIGVPGIVALLTVQLVLGQDALIVRHVMSS